jgi:glyoxylase-like metal-dependent hydrolase (beta-lactamase superfamily II)
LPGLGPSRINPKNKSFVQQIAPMLNVKIFTFNPLQENTYLLYNEHKECIIIDPGCYFQDEREKLVSFIQTAGLSPRMLMNTHCHLDHVFGNRFIHEEYGLELHIHQGEVPVLERAPASGLMWNVPFDNYDGPIHFLEESVPVHLGQDRLDVLLLPGHSPASVGFFSKLDGFIIGGDVLFRESVGRTDLPGGNPKMLEQSILQKLYVLPDETVVYSGHGIPTTIGHEKKYNPYVSV